MGDQVDRGEGDRIADQGTADGRRQVDAEHHGDAGSHRNLRNRNQQSEEDADRAANRHRAPAQPPQALMHETRPEPLQPAIAVDVFRARYESAQPLQHAGTCFR